jgi:signal transduction histidine kinase
MTRVPAQGGLDCNLADARIALEALVAASSHANAIVGSMRALAGCAAPVRERCRLDQAFDEVLDGARAELSRLGIDCSVAFGRGARTALAQPVQLRQLLRNLVANAIDALRGVSGRVRVLRIEARLDRAGGLRLTVRDNGIGIDAAQARRVFDPLVTTKVSGLGLGLAICKSIVAAHGGRIWAEPLPAHGCMFTCLLPHAAPGAPLAGTTVFRGHHE